MRAPAIWVVLVDATSISEVLDISSRRETRRLLSMRANVLYLFASSRLGGASSVISVSSEDEGGRG